MGKFEPRDEKRTVMYPECYKEIAFHKNIHVRIMTSCILSCTGILNLTMKCYIYLNQ